MAGPTRIPKLTDAARDKIRAVFEVEEGMPVWRERTADFYRQHFPRAFDPEGAAEAWNEERAGHSPRWQLSTSRDDYLCNAWQRQVSLKEVCEALALPYTATREKIEMLVDALLLRKKKRLALISIELKDGEPVWRKRTRQTHPRTDMTRLDEFNRDYAGKKPRLHEGSYYVICRHKIKRDDVIKWLKEE